MAERYGSDLLAAAHETALGMRKAGVISRRRMEEYNEMCLAPVEELAPERIREIRLHENASRAVFARYLNVTAGLVGRWERGEERPDGPAVRLLTLIDRHGLGAVV